jgi:hypothetical protein
MLTALFSSSRQRTSDTTELKSHFTYWERDVLKELKRRASNKSLSTRSRKHWQRLYWQMRLGLVKLPPP